MKTKIKQFFIEHFPVMIQFSMAGTISSVFYYLLFVAFWQWGHINYQVAISLAYLLSSVVHFLYCRKYAFQSHQHAMLGQAMKYMVMLAINYGFTITIVHFLSASYGVSPYLSVGVSIAVTVILGFLLANYWVFKVQKAYSANDEAF